MGFKFRKSVKIAPGIKLNLGKKSAGISFGGKGFRHSVSTSGRKTTSVGIPGTGLSYTTSHSKGKTKSSNPDFSSNFSSSDNTTVNNTPEKPKKKGCGLIAAVIAIILFIIGGIGSCGSNDDVDTTTSVFNNIELNISSYKQDVDLEVGETSGSYIYISLRDEDFTIDYLKENLVFKSSDENVAKFYLDTETDLKGYIYYKIDAIGEGTATLHIETSDGAIKSNEITVTVSAPETTSTTEDETTEVKTTQKETTTNKNITTTEDNYEEIIETTKKTSGRTVYVTPSGKRYHYSSACAGDNGRAVSIDEVGSRTACQKCAQ